MEMNECKYLNNPLNIRVTKDSWVGGIGGRNGFCQFESIESGIRAACIIIMRSYRKRWIFRLQGIINRWAPSSDGNNPHVYARFVANRTGMRVFEKIDTPAKVAHLISAMAEFEQGAGFDLPPAKVLEVIQLYNIKFYQL